MVLALLGFLPHLALGQSNSVAPLVIDPSRVVQLSAAASPLARAIELEQQSLLRDLDRSDSKLCAQRQLVQSVFAQLANDQRDAAALEALNTSYQLAALQHQLPLLEQADKNLQALTQASERARELGLPDEKTLDLELQRLEVRDAMTRATYGARKLQHQLAEQLNVSQEVIAISEIVFGELALELPADDASAWEVAKVHRGDYLALAQLSGGWTADTHDVALGLLGMVQPGIGLALHARTPGLLVKLVHHSNAPRDLACRRTQSRSLLEQRQQSIKLEIAITRLSLEEATERLSLARQSEQLAAQRVVTKRSAEQLDRAPGGSEQLAVLEQLKLQGTRIDQERDESQARAKLARVLGILAP
jgi:hypothetical protein